MKQSQQISEASDAASRRANLASMIAIFAVALALRLVVVAFCEPTAERDGIVYMQLAESLAAGRGYERPGMPGIERPVGYPAFIAIHLWLGGGMRAVAFTQALLGALTAVMMLVLGRRMGLDERHARIGAWALALFPDLVAYPALLLAETLFAFLAVAGVLLAGATTSARSPFLRIAGGAILGLATLVRSTGLIFVLLWLALEFVLRAPQAARASRAKRAALVLLGMALVVAPWSVFATNEAGRFVIVDLTLDVSLRIGHQPGHLGEKQDLVVPAGEHDPIERPFPERAAAHRRWAIAEIVAHPGATLERSLLKLVRLLHPRGDLELLEASTLSISGHHVGGSWWLASTLATELFLLALIVAFARKRSEWVTLAPALAMGLAVLASTLLVFFAGRYRQPAIIMMAPMAAMCMASRGGDSHPLQPRLFLALLILHTVALIAATWLDAARYVENFTRLAPW